MDYAKWITVTASVVTPAGVVLLWLQFKRLQKQVQADHERSRRELAVRLIQHWSGAISPVTAAARRVVGSLDDTQCRDLEQIKPFNTEVQLRPFLETCLADILAEDLLKIEGDRLQLTVKQSTRLRYLVAIYLNETEAVLLAWFLSIADRQIIEQEFSPLYDERGGHDFLAKFRKAAGNEAFPAIDKFIEHLRKSRNAGRPDVRPQLPSGSAAGRA